MKQRDVIKTYNLPPKVRFCKICTVSNQRPRITFDEHGVCSACNFATYKRSKIDWAERERELVDLCHRHRKHNGDYDVIVPCSGGKDEEPGPEASASIGPLQKAEPPAPAEMSEPVVDADLHDAAEETPAKPESKNVVDGKAIPPAIRGRWALKAADCKAKKGTDLTALAIDATNLRFYESHGELTRVRESDASRIVAN